MRKKNFAIQPLAAAVLLTFAHQAAAETETLPALVVTGVGQTSPVTVVTNPKLPRQPMPASDGADYLKTIPGFSAMRSGGVNSDPVFRGMFGSRLKLLTNGGEMLGACPSRMDSPSSYISPEAYDQLTVIKGPQTVQWGPGNSAATILFERGPEEFYQWDTRLDASLLTGSQGRFDRNLDAALGNQQGYLRLTANGSQAQDYKDGDKQKVPSRWDKYNADIALGFMPTVDTWLEVSAGFGDGEARYAGRAMDGTQFKRESLGIKFRQMHLSDTWQSLDAQVYYNFADHIMDNYKLRSAPNNPDAAMPMMRGAFANQVLRETIGGRIKSTWQLNQLELTAGIDGQFNHHKGRKGAADLVKQQAKVKDAEFTQVGIFTEANYQLAEQNQWVAGVRVDEHRATDKRAELCTGMNACLANPSADKELKKTLVSGFMRYEHYLPSLAATSYLGLGYSERFPDYWELFSATSKPLGSGMNPTGFEPTAFMTAKPEKTTQLDFGIQYDQGGVELWASGYVGHIKDYLLFNYTSGAMMAMTNVRNVDAKIMGAELGGSHRFAADWKAETSLAYSWGKNTSDQRPLPQMPPLEAKFALNYETESWGAGFLTRLVSKQTRIDKDSGNVAGKDFNKSSSFALFSANAAYNINSNFRTSVGIDNLLNKNYSEHLNLGGNAGFGLSADNPINEAGRTFWARLDIKY